MIQGQKQTFRLSGTVRLRGASVTSWSTSRPEPKKCKSLTAIGTEVYPKWYRNLAKVVEYFPRSGIGVFGERLLYHLGHFPVPLWAMYRTTLRKVLYHLGSNCYRFDCKHGILCIRPCETPLHMWYVPRFVTTEYITRFVTKIHPLRQFLR